MRFLSVSRALIAFATTLHLIALRWALRLGDRRVSRAMRNTDTATVVHRNAVQAMSQASKDKSAAKRVERAVRTEITAFRTAVVAEADSLRRDHGLI